MEFDEEAGFGNVEAMNLNSLCLSHDESFRVDVLDLKIDLNVDLNVPQVEMQEEVVVFEVPIENMVTESHTHVDVQPAVVEGRSKEQVVE
ncbi:hypothetical protein Tco_0302179, partial [Tanacetum coccineum]